MPRLQVKRDNPSISFADVGKELGKRWANVSASEKVKYEELAKQDKERYIKEKAEYDSKNPS